MSRGRKTVIPVEAPAEGTPDGGKYVEGGAQITIPKSNSSAALFPEQFSEPEPKQPEPQKPQEEPQPTPAPQPEPEKPAQEPEQEPEKPAEQPQPESNESVYLEDLLQKLGVDPSKVKTRTKIDGVEGEASILEVKKNYQLERHLTQRGQKIGEERRQLEQIRNELLRKAQPQNAPVPNQEDSNEDPSIRALRQEVEELRSILPAIQPVLYQSARQKLADELKDQGFPDFMDYIGKIDARVAAESDDNKWRYYNTPEGAKQLFFQMKLEEQRNGTQAKAVPNKPTIEPVKQEHRPPVVKIDGGNQPSKGNVDDWNTRYGELMTQWKKTKDRSILQEILKLQGALHIK